jgi:hypothetical protein
MHTAGGENGYSGVRVSPVLLVTDQPGTAQLCSLVNLNSKFPVLIKYESGLYPGN